jgi:hypothetical protein
VVRVAHDETEDADHLERRLRLAVVSCSDDDSFGGGDAAQTRDRQLATEQRDHHPRLDPAHVHEPDQRRHDDELVRERIEELPEHADEPLLPRDVAVEEVGDRGGGVDPRGPETIARAPSSEEHEDDRDHQNSRERQQIGNVDGVIFQRPTTRDPEASYGVTALDLLAHARASTTSHAPRAREAGNMLSAGA